MVGICQHTAGHRQSRHSGLLGLLCRARRLLWERSTAMVEASPSYLAATTSSIPRSVERCLVLAHSYPYLSLSDFGNAASGVPGIS